MRTILDLPRETLELISPPERKRLSRTSTAGHPFFHALDVNTWRSAVSGLLTLRLCSAQHDMFDSEILEYLIGLFSYTIVMLHQLKFVDYFSLYIQDIQDIGRIENLRDLHLDISATPSGEQHLQICYQSGYF
ncbi:hypothetical protein PGTUg99_015946 [Puccinia graminis f. sp. tritici]|uniref:Uncharacterized protein n=1 Tax=Puccinia graminis f. sp. tritici TaxID=56615 RepID=A0A5B0RBJ6_PUCGR|nr:hypothetical protein PGTUg99_015946 [Puccinia graminis f. sp. tritici]